MKSLYRIASLIAVFAAALVSCSGLEEPEAMENEGQKATFTFTPQFLDPDSDEPGTKAFADNPTIHNIFFAVFDGTGYKLSEYAEAVPNTSANVNGEKFKYSVELTISKEPRIIHIIANAPKRLVYGSEAEVIGALKTFINAPDPNASEGEWKEAYWTRLYLENGVWEEPNEDKHGMVGTPGYEAQNSKYMSVVNTLNNAKLVRNFARIVVDDEGASNFELKGIWLTNYPNLGSVAPYNRTTGNFQIDYDNYSTVEAMMTGAKYVGYTPASAEIVKISSAAPMTGASLNNAGTYHVAKTFCYEREKPTANPLYIIIKGSYNGHDDSYYKIDLRDDKNEYFPILRNFSYRVHISSVANDGAAGLDEALNGPPNNGDVSTSLEMQELTNISNGESQLFVSQTSALIVGTDVVQLRYKYIPKLEGPTAGTVKNGTTPDDDGYVTITSTVGDTGAAFSSYEISNTDAGDDYRVITLYPNTPDALYKDQTFTITGQYNTGNVDSKGNPVWETITRTVEYRLRERLSMTLSCTPVVPSVQNSPVDITIGLEPGLPSSIFSLNFNIEAGKLCLTTDPGEALPVKTGASTISTGKPGYYFVKTLTWQEYKDAPVVDGYKRFTIRLRTNKTFSGGEGDNIYVSNNYFFQNNCSFTTKQILISQDFAGNYYETNGHLHESENLSFKVVAGPGVQLKKLTYAGTEYTNGSIVDSGNDTYKVNTTARPSYGVDWNTGTITIQLQDNGIVYNYSYDLTSDVWREGDFVTMQFIKATNDGYIYKNGNGLSCGSINNYDINNPPINCRWIIEPIVVNSVTHYLIKVPDTNDYWQKTPDDNTNETISFGDLSGASRVRIEEKNLGGDHYCAINYESNSNPYNGYLNQYGGRNATKVGVWTGGGNDDGDKIKITAYPSNPREGNWGYEWFPPTP